MIPSDPSLRSFHIYYLQEFLEVLKYYIGVRCWQTTNLDMFPAVNYAVLNENGVVAVARDNND